MDSNLIITICVIVGCVLLRILLPVIFNWTEPKPGSKRGVIQKFVSMIFTSVGGAVMLIPILVVVCILYSGWEALLKLLKN